jgi:hypothetical protein
VRRDEGHRRGCVQPLTQGSEEGKGGRGKKEELGYTEGSFERGKGGQYSAGRGQQTGR